MLCHVIMEDLFYRIDGGAARNDFICQLLADLSDLPVERMVSTETACAGVAYVSGISCSKYKYSSNKIKFLQIFTDLWSNKTVKSLQVIETTFFPSQDDKYREALRNHMENWLKLVKNDLN